MIKKINSGVLNRLVRPNGGIYSFYKMNKRYMLDFDPSRDYYKILGVENIATAKQIKEAYFKLAKKHHPDLNQGKTTDMFKEMTAAYDILSDQEKKKQYDEYRGNFKNQQSQHTNTYYGNQQQNYNDYAKYNDAYKNSNFKHKTTYYYKDPKTGQYKSTNSEGDYKGNPFFKDFEDFFKSSSQNWESASHKKSKFGDKYYDKNKEYFDEFYRKDDKFYDPYNINKSNMNDNFKWHPSDYEYMNYLYAKRIFKIIFFSTIFFFIMLSMRSRERRRYYEEGQVNPYVTFTPYPPQQDMGYPNTYPSPNHMGPVVQPKYNQKQSVYSQDPYTNPYVEPKLR